LRIVIIIPPVARRYGDVFDFHARVDYINFFAVFAARESHVDVENP